MKIKVDFRLSAEALRIIEDWAEQHGLTRTAGLESLTRRFASLEGIARNPADRLGKLRSAIPLRGESESPEVNDRLVQKKSERKKRKAELQESVKEALPSRSYPVHQFHSGA